MCKCPSGLFLSIRYRRHFRTWSVCSDRIHQISPDFQPTFARVTQDSVCYLGPPCSKKTSNTLIPILTCAVPPIDIFSDSGAKAVDVSRRLKDLEIKVQQIDSLSLKLSSLTSLIAPSNDAYANNLAATGRFLDSVIKETHKFDANARNAVVFNILDHSPPPPIQPTILDACSTARLP